MKRNKILKLSFAIIITFFFYNVFWENWNNNNVSCSAINNNNGIKSIAVQSDLWIWKPSIWSFSCENNNYYWWEWEWPYNKWETRNCSNKWFVSQIQYSGNTYQIYCKKINTNLPSIDISFLWWNVLATDDYTIPISYLEWSVWPASISFKIENHNNANIIDSINMNWNSFSLDLSKVDNDRTGLNYREYTLTLDSLCDQSGLCMIWLPKTYYYNVYSNTTSNNIGPISFNWVSNFTSKNIADWIPYQLSSKITDIYWNEIVPAPWINRTVDFNFNVSNTLSEDQYNNSWDWVYLTTPNDSSYTNKLTNSNSFNNLNSSNWEYPFNFRVYAPTINWNNFNINNVSTDINWDIWNRQNIPVIGSNINFDFDPLYEAWFNWEQDAWFIEWISQTWSINISKNWNDSSVVSNSKKLYLQKDWIKKNEFNWSWEVRNNIKDDILNSINTFINSFSIITKYTLETLFTLNPINPWFLDDIKDVYINTWIWYTIDSKSILYKSNSIWNTNNTNQFWLKVYWLTNIDNSKQKDLVENQDINDIKNVAWKITKSSLKKDIRKNAFSIMKNIDWSTSWTNLVWWKVTFYDFKNEQTEESKRILNLSGGDLWKDRTIVVLGANVYITWNLSIWWLIVLKDDQWYWWNLYVEPNVTKIESIIYLDKSILSYNTLWWEISQSNWWTSEVLKNQLYIYWSLFSDNTIWGSRIDPPVCPFYEYSNPGFLCDTEEAQKDDLNYLRLWIENKSNSLLADYPLIIEYNPKLQLNPPPLFSN